MKKYTCSSDLIRKLHIIAEECIECGRCTKKCSLLKESPKKTLKNIAENNSIDIELPYSCTQCNLCKIECPKNISFGNIFLEIRRDYSKLKNEHLEINGYKTIKYHQKNSFSKTFTAMHTYKNEKVTKIFLPGCSLAAYDPKLVIKTYNYMKSKCVDIGILLKCCGNPTHLIGQSEKFTNYYKSLIDEINNLGATEVITACPSCYKTIAENSPKIKIKSIWEFLLEIGLPKERYNQILDNDVSNISIHDPCPIRDYEVIHESVRKIITFLNIKPKEFINSKEKTLCCGVGGMIGVTDIKRATENIQKRVNEIDSDIIITYCASCVDAFRFGNKASLHLLELLFDSEINLMSKKYKLNKNTAQKWINRYKCKKAIKNLI